jgi:pimeloyl-ACP methyl ester carboxylesterase
MQPVAVERESAEATSPSIPGQAAAVVPEGDSSIPEHTLIVSDAAQPGLVAFARELPPRGSLWVGPLRGNGGRDVVIYIPAGPDDRAGFQLVYHFHGTYSEHIEKQRTGLPKKTWVGWNRLQQTLDAAAELQDKRAFNVALVYPISAGKRPEPDHSGWFNKAYDRMWMMQTDLPEYTDAFDTLHEEVVEILQGSFGVHPSNLMSPVIAEGHSAGGMALLNIALGGSRNVGEYIFQDAGFQGWGDGCFEAVRASNTGARVTLVITEGGIADPFGKRDPWCTTLAADAEAWTRHERWCEGQPTGSPPRSEKSCALLEMAAEEWNELRPWCEDMKEDMRNTPGVFVHRTRIHHGDQPRHFTGGLELPEHRDR